MKKIILLVFIIIVGVTNIRAQVIDDLTGAPILTDGQLDTLGQDITRTNNFFIFAGSNIPGSTSWVLNGVEIPSLAQGWYTDDGLHIASNINYICGYYSSYYSSNYYRNFIAVDLSNLSGYGITLPITSAVLKVQKYSSNPNNGFAVWDLHSVSTSWQAINTSYSSGDTVGQAIFNDLGTGLYYGNGVVDGSLPNTYIIETPLNNQAIADINAVIGGTFVIGGRANNFFTNAPPTAITNAATNITSSSATLNGSVNANGTSTNVSFVFGTTSGNLTQSANAVPYTLTGTTAVAVSANISGLTPGLTYYFRLRSENIEGAVVYGLEMQFVASDNQASVPLSAWSIYLGVFFIGIFIIVRYRRSVA